jgi:hypothetical protein
LIERPRFEKAIEAARTILGEETFSVLWAEGRAMSLEQAVAYALEELEEKVD